MAKQSSFLSTLKFTSVQKPKAVAAIADPKVKRRNRLIEKLEEQAALAQAELAGEKFEKTKEVTTKDANGNRTKVFKSVEVDPWYWPVGDEYAMVIKYGVRTLPLGKKGETNFTVPKLKDVPGVVQSFKRAVEAGELDDLLAAATAGMGKPKKQ